MAASSLIFIPDITGFSEFVDQTAVRHGEHIISELLELIIDEDQLGLTVSEVEGDAVFFYGEGEMPSSSEIIEQARKTFIKFHYHLKDYETRRICNCGACTTASRLSLKFIAHAGELGFTTVKGHRKPYGTAVVEAHRLLKNTVDLREYLLITDGVVKRIGSGGEDLVMFAPGASSYEKEGEMNYYFKDLAPYFSEIPDPPLPPAPRRVSNPIAGSIIVDRPLDHVYEIVTNLELRSSWNPQAKEIQFDEGIVNRIGVKHRCLFEGGNHADFETISDDLGDGKIAYGERIEAIPFTQELSVFWIMEELGQSEVKVSMEVHHIPKGLPGRIFALIIKLRFRKNIEPTLEQIKKVCEAYT